jgi:hypothetical protein
VTLGFRNVSTPWPMNTADNKGRAILRINMTAVFPGWQECKPGVQTGGHWVGGAAEWRTHSGNATQKKT